MDKSNQDRYNYFEKRYQLVESLKRKGITDEHLLFAIGEVPRENFVEKGFINRAYDDTALPIRHNQTISQPYTVAYMTELLEIQKGDKVLEIGTGSGYQAAILSFMGARVYTIERITKLIDKTINRFKDLDLDVKCFEGDGTLGLPDHAPFDKIIITAGAPEAPVNLIKQLKSGGRLVVPIGERDYQTMYLIIKNKNGRIEKHKKDTFKFVPLLGRYGWDRE
jgi:protein-L-isoaspartate(D-aspartate) O-methyltransferase